MITSSLYVPDATVIMSPADAAATAADIVDLHPPVPDELTQRLAASSPGAAQNSNADAAKVSLRAHR